MLGGSGYHVFGCRAALANMELEGGAIGAYASVLKALLAFPLTRPLLLALPLLTQRSAERVPWLAPTLVQLRQAFVAPFFGNSVACRLPRHLVSRHETLVLKKFRAAQRVVVWMPMAAGDAEAAPAVVSSRIEAAESPLLGTHRHSKRLQERALLADAAGGARQTVPASSADTTVPLPPSAPAGGEPAVVAHEEDDEEEALKVSPPFPPPRPPERGSARSDPSCPFPLPVRPLLAGGRAGPRAGLGGQHAPGARLPKVPEGAGGGDPQVRSNSQIRSRMRCMLGLGLLIRWRPLQRAVSTSPLALGAETPIPCRRWMEPVLSEAAGCIILGDMNAPPNEDLHRLFRRRGFRSAHRAVHGRDPVMTWPSGIIAPLMDLGDPHCADYIYFKAASGAR